MHVKLLKWERRNLRPGKKGTFTLKTSDAVGGMSDGGADNGADRRGDSGDFYQSYKIDTYKNFIKLTSFHLTARNKVIEAHLMKSGW